MDPSLTKPTRPHHGRHDTTDYEETAPLTSLSEVSRTVSRESSTRIMSGTGTTVEHPRRVYWSFWLLGAVILLSWNVLLCTLPLFTALLPRESALRHSLPSYITTFFTLGNFGFLFAAQSGVGKISQNTRLHSSLWLLAAATGLTAFPLLPAIFPILPSAPYFIALIALTLIFSYATSYLQSSVLAIAALWGPQEMLAVMSGQGGIAVLISAVQVYIAVMGVYASADAAIVKGPSDGSPSTAELASGMGLWMAAIVPIVICIIMTRRLFPRGAGSPTSAAASQYPKLSFVPAGADEDGEFYDTERRFSAEEDEESRRGSTRGFHRSWAIMKRNRVINFSVAYVFIVTLAIFPSITTSIVSVRQPPPKLLDPAVFVPLHFLAFNVSDYLGRTYLPTIPMLFFHNSRHVMFASLARTLFIPVFMLCNTSFADTSSLAHVPFINSDIVYFIILFLFGASNGWISSLSMIIASSPTMNPAIEEDEKDVAGSLAGFCLTGGLVVGSLASFVVGWIVKR
ncbi:hypothetical protein NliqN6_0658 [Naganishia liquefaciens]|uniref:Nucleoside transporter n=1 Tax=Naganishia liquefaciens TaxID=104408 RepID=A0A8H3TN88_9TREE|nr:hypothetical protein NliqN6_0658 [Naganishia liquefaciens]